MATLARINIAPLKGTALRHPEEAHLATAGLAGDRRFHLVDERGRLFSVGDHGALVRVRSTYDPDAETLVLDLPDGSRVTGPADRVADEIVTDFYGRPVPGRVLDGSFAAALSSFAGRMLRVVRADRPGDGSDVHHLSLVSWASVRDLGQRDGRPDLDPRRFRMALEIDGCAPYEEDTWEGHDVRVGEALIRIHGPVPRCVATTRDPLIGTKDFDTLKRIAAYRPLMREPRGVPFGMYAEVVRPGTVHVGDPVGLVGRPEHPAQP